MENALGLFGGLSGIGVAAAGIGVAYAQFKSGANKAKDDLIVTLKDTALVERQKAERLSAEKANIMTSHQTQINELNKQIGILQGTLQATDKKLQEYAEILQGRSPEQTQFMQFMTQSAKETLEHMTNSNQVLKEIQFEINTLRSKCSTL